MQLGAEDCGSGMAWMRDTARGFRPIGASGAQSFVGRRGTAWLSAMPRHPVLKTRIKGMASEKSRVIRKDLQEVLRWLRRNRAALRRKYYSSSKAKSQSDSFDKVLRYLTAIDEGDYWKSPSLDSEGTEIRLRDLMDSLNDQREESTIINVFSAFNVKVILEHASWEVGLERMIEFVSHGKNKTKEEKEKEKKKQGPDEPSLEPIHRYSEIIYSNYQNYPPKLFKKNLCRTILWCRAFDGQDDSDLVLYGAQSMSDELGVDLDYVVVESEEDLRKKLAVMTIARRGKDVDGTAFILEGFKDPEGWERMSQARGDQVRIEGLWHPQDRHRESQ